MAKKTMIVGAMLLVLGGVVTVLSDSGSITSLIPSFIGAILVVLALVALWRPAVLRRAVVPGRSAGPRGASLGLAR